MPEETMSRKKKVGYFIYILIALLVLVILNYLTDQQESEEDEPVVTLDIPIPEGQTGPLPNFSEFTNVVEKKKAFFSYLLPEIERQNALVMQERIYVETLAAKSSRSKTDVEKLSRLYEKYKIDDALDDEAKLKLLLRRIDIIPAELVLVQAANESAWGTSRFAQQGYNFFGMWCFKKGCGFVPKQRNDGAIHEVAKFNSIGQAVSRYIRNLNRHPAYKELRDIRYTLRNSNQPISAEKLAKGLIRYSERGQEYIDELLSMINHNKKYMQP